MTYGTRIWQRRAVEKSRWWRQTERRSWTEETLRSRAAFHIFSLVKCSLSCAQSWSDCGWVVITFFWVFISNFIGFSVAINPPTPPKPLKRKEISKCHYCCWDISILASTEGIPIGLQVSGLSGVTTAQGNTQLCRNTYWRGNRFLHSTVALFHPAKACSACSSLSFFASFSFSIHRFLYIPKARVYTIAFLCLNICSTLTWGQWPGRTMPLPVLVCLKTRPGGSMSNKVKSKAGWEPI